MKGTKTTFNIRPNNTFYKVDKQLNESVSTNTINLKQDDDLNPYAGNFVFNQALRKPRTNKSVSTGQGTTNKPKQIDHEIGNATSNHLDNTIDSGCKTLEPYGFQSVYSYKEVKAKDTLLRYQAYEKETPATINKRLLAANHRKEWCPFIS